MKINKIKKRLNAVGAVGLISVLSLSGLSSVAFAADTPYSDPQTYKDSMTVNASTTVLGHNDLNSDGLVNEGDIVDVNLTIENTSDKDYNYVDVSSLGFDLNRELVSSSLAAGDSVDYPISYTVNKGDEYTGYADHGIYVNVRDNSLLESTIKVDAYVGVDSDNSLVFTDNGRITGLIMDKETGNISVRSIDEYNNYYGIDESRLVEEYHTAVVGDGFVYAFDFTNTTDETITLNQIEYVDNVIEENISGTVVEPGETINLYAISEITLDDLDWGLTESKATVGGGFYIIVSDTNETVYNIANGSSNFSSSSASLSTETVSTTSDQGGSAIAEIAYNYYNHVDYPTVVVNGIVSDTFGVIEVNDIVNTNESKTVNAPETIVLEDGESFEEISYFAYTGLYHSEDVLINSSYASGSYESDTGGGLGDEFPAPTLSNPVCGEEAQVILPQEFIDEYNEIHFVPYDMELLTYEVEKQDDNTYYVYAVDWNFPMLIDEWTLEIPAVVPCPVETPEPETPVFVAPTCDDDFVITVPENNSFYNYTTDTVDNTVVVNAVLVETGEIAETWSFDVVEATDCVIEPPVVEIPDYEEPVFTAPTCDDEVSIVIPESNEFYNYSVIGGVEADTNNGSYNVQVRSVETNELLDTWVFAYVVPTDCDTVVPPVEIPEPPVEEELPPIEEEVPPVVEEVPEKPVVPVEPPVIVDKPVNPPKKINSGELSEVVENNSPAFVVITIAGLIIALTTGGVMLVRSRKN